MFLSWFLSGTSGSLVRQERPLNELVSSLWIGKLGTLLANAPLRMSQ